MNTINSPEGKVKIVQNMSLLWSQWFPSNFVLTKVSLLFYFWFWWMTILLGYGLIKISHFDHSYDHTDRRRTIVWLVPNWIVPNCERNHVSVTETGSLCLWHLTLQCVTLKQSSWNEIERFEPSHAKAQVKVCWFFLPVNRWLQLIKCNLLCCLQKHLKEVAFWLEFLRHPMPCRSCRAIWIYFSAQSERCSLPRRNRSRN